MAKRKAYIYFYGIMMVYFIIRWLRSRFDLPDFIRFQFTDLLFVPAMSLFALIVIRLIKRDDNLRIPVWTVFFQVILVSVYFEYYLPTYQANVHPYTSDKMDVFMYFIGGGIFVVLQQRI